MPRRTVFFAKITREPQRRLFDRDFRTDMLAAIDPDLVHTRYNRTWRFSRPVEIDDQHIAGKLGFTHVGEQEQTEYDEEAQDFITTQAPARQTFFSHFVIDTDAEVIAFEDRGRLIRRRSFLGAFEGLLAEGDFLATVEELTDPASLREWAAGVDRVVRIKAVVHNPNPGWVEDAGAIREIVEETEADVADVTVKASQDGGLNVDAEWIDGAMSQVSEHGQGRMSALGFRGDRETRWTTGQQVRTDSIDEDPTDDSQTIWQRLIGKIRDIL